MPKSHEVANELRKLADALDTIADADIKYPLIGFYYHYSEEKESFLALAKVLPRPYEKKFEDGERGEIALTYRTPAVVISTSIPRSAVCRIVEPAKPAVYDCQPLLSAEEEAALEPSNAAA